MNYLKKAYLRVRKLLFTKDRPEGTYLLVEADVEDVERALGRHYFGPNWSLSFNYRGEDINLAKKYYEDNAEFPQIKWWQTHIRGWDTGKYVELSAHYETEPAEYPDDHWNEIGVEIDRAMNLLEIVLQQSELNYVGEFEYAGK